MPRGSRKPHRPLPIRDPRGGGDGGDRICSAIWLPDLQPTCRPAHAATFRRERCEAERRHREAQDAAEERVLDGLVGDADADTDPDRLVEAFESGRAGCARFAKKKNVFVSQTV